MAISVSNIYCHKSYFKVPSFNMKLNDLHCNMESSI